MDIFRLKKLRKKRHLSQINLAMELNMSQNSISQYKNGVREADNQTLTALADYFNVSIDYLLGRTDNPEINRWPSTQNPHWQGTHPLPVGVLCLFSNFPYRESLDRLVVLNKGAPNGIHFHERSQFRVVQLQLYMIAQFMRHLKADGHIFFRKEHRVLAQRRKNPLLSQIFL